jgi:hypothetical protein
VSANSNNIGGNGIENKVVVVTGASSGFGEEPARHLSAKGASLLLGARRLDRLESMAADLRKAGGKVEVLAADVKRRADVQALVDGTGTAVRWVRNPDSIFRVNADAIGQNSLSVWPEFGKIGPGTAVSQFAVWGSNKLSANFYHKPRRHKAHRFHKLVDRSRTAFCRIKLQMTVSNNDSEDRRRNVRTVPASRNGTDCDVSE